MVLDIMFYKHGSFQFLFFFFCCCFVLVVDEIFNILCLVLSQSHDMSFYSLLRVLQRSVMH